MPYFKNDIINLLLIHIPKTGGTSLNYYFSKKYNIPLNKHSYYTDDIVNKKDFFKGVSLQHQMFVTLFNNQNIFKIDWTNSSLKIITVVRNPYYRIISDLLWHGFIKENTDKNEVFNKIKWFITLRDIDNHNKPQNKFITFENGTLIPNIIIMKTETLTYDMILNGYDDFDLKDQSNKTTKDYMEFFNKDSILLINDIYKKDFQMFQYTMVNP